MTKEKKVIRIFGHENGNKTSFRNLIGPRKKFPSPQTRRQVSATASTYSSCPFFLLRILLLLSRPLLICLLLLFLHLLLLPILSTCPHSPPPLSSPPHMPSPPLPAPTPPT